MSEEEFDDSVDDASKDDEELEFEDEADEHEDSGEHFEDKMKKGEKEEDVYSKEGREELEEDDEVSPAEAGFAKGATKNKKHK